MNFCSANSVQSAKPLDAAVFYHKEIEFSKSLSAIVGGRFDRIKADAANPALVGKAYGAFYSASATVSDPSVFASLVYKPTDTSSVYFTFDKINAITGSANFGGVDATGGTAGLIKSLKADSKLYEVGYKTSLLKNTLYAGVAIFQQTRIRPQLRGPAALVKTNGIEAEAVYQPTKALSLNANVTFQDATQYSSFLYEQTTSYLDLYPVGYIVDGKSGTGAGSPNYGGFSPPSGKVRAPGVPQFLANAFATYAFTPQFGIGAGPQINGRQNANAEGSLHIPLQWQWDGYVYYRINRWDVQVSVKNMLNAKLFDPIDVGFAGNDVVFYRAPISASLTVRYRF